MKPQLYLALLAFLVAPGCFAQNEASSSAASPNVANGGAAPKTRPYLYSKAGIMMLEVSKPIQFSILNAKNPSRRQNLLTTALPKASEATITGETSTVGKEVVNTMKIAFGKIIINDTSAIDSFELDIETTLYSNVSYWKITRMSVSYAAHHEGVKYNGTDEDIWVDKVPGHTHAFVDLNCERGFSSCAPRYLSWTCDYQTFRSKQLDDKKAANNGADLLFPGLELQPFEGKENGKERFGFNWDCDPLISIPIWTSLLIGLLLILALFWSCDMIAALQTPDRFDDPKGAPILVPNTD